MEHKDFVEKTIMTFVAESFEAARRHLVGEYLNFEFVDEKDITKTLLADKVIDYFITVEQKNLKPFDKLVNSYITDLKSIVDGRVEETPKPKKKAAAPAIVPRARQYYEKAQSITESRNLTVRNLIDYTRIMMCLYTSIIDNNYKPISNLDFSANILNVDKIINSMKNEKASGAKKIVSKTLFNTQELYDTDTCTFIMTIILLQTIVNERG